MTQSNVYYCWTNESEPEHSGGWFCQHPDCLNVEQEVISPRISYDYSAEDETDTLNTFYSGIEA